MPSSKAPANPTGWNAMMARRWRVVDVFGRRWRLWSAVPGDPAALTPAEARVALGTLVHGSFASSPDPGDRVAATLFEIHNAFTGERVSHHEWVRADLGTARRMSSSVSESLEWAVRSRRLGIAPDVQRSGRPAPLEDEAPDTSRDAVVPETTSWFELRVVDEVGAPIDGLDVAFATGSGTRRQLVRTAGGGIARLDGMTMSFLSASLANLEQLREKLAPRWKKPRQPRKFKDAAFVLRELGESVTAPLSLESESATTLVITPHFECHEIPGAHFAFGRSFVRSDAIENLATIAEDLSADEERQGMIFGHTDQMGSGALNKELSERRARAVLALFTHDAEAWEELFSGTADGRHWKEKWDLEEAQHMLNALHVTDDHGQPVHEKGVRDASTKQAIHRFRAADYAERPADQMPLPPSGFLGKDGRRELFLAYAKLISRKPIDPSRFQKIGDSDSMGCGDFNPLSLTRKDAESRRAVVFVFHGAAGPRGLPCQLQKLGPCTANSRPLPKELDAEGPPFRCKVYQALAARCPCKGGLDLSHDLFVRVPIPLARVNDFEHRLILESDDGTFSRTKALNADVRALDAGECELFFSHLPPAHQYRMRAEGIPEPYEVFPFTAFEDLSSITAAVSTIDEERLIAAALAVDPPEATS